jgi:hypothetical protein
MKVMPLIRSTEFIPSFQGFSAKAWNERQTWPPGAFSESIVAI